MGDVAPTEVISETEDEIFAYTLESAQGVGRPFDFVVKLGELVRNVHTVKLIQVTLPFIQDIITADNQLTLDINPVVATPQSLLDDMKAIQLDSQRSLVYHTDATQGIFHLVETLGDRVNKSAAQTFNRQTINQLEVALLSDSNASLISTLLYQEQESLLSQESILRLAVVVPSLEYTNPSRVSYSSEISVGSSIAKHSIARIDDSQSVIALLGTNSQLSITLATFETAQQSDLFAENTIAAQVSSHARIRLDEDYSLILTRSNGRLTARVVQVTNIIEAGSTYDIGVNLTGAFSGVASPLTRQDFRVAVVLNQGATSRLISLRVNTEFKVIQEDIAFGSFIEQPLLGRLDMVSLEPLPGATYQLENAPIQVSSVQLGVYSNPPKRRLEFEANVVDDSIEILQQTVSTDSILLKLASSNAPDNQRVFVSYIEFNQTLAQVTLTYDLVSLPAELKRGNVLELKNPTAEQVSVSREGVLVDTVAAGEIGFFPLDSGILTLSSDSASYDFAVENNTGEVVIRSVADEVIQSVARGNLIELTQSRSDVLTVALDAATLLRPFKDAYPMLDYTLSLKEQGNQYLVVTNDGRFIELDPNPEWPYLKAGLTGTLFTQETAQIHYNFLTLAASLGSFSFVDRLGLASSVVTQTSPTSDIFLAGSSFSVGGFDANGLPNSDESLRTVEVRTNQLCAFNTLVIESAPTSAVRDFRLLVDDRALLQIQLSSQTTYRLPLCIGRRFTVIIDRALDSRSTVVLQKINFILRDDAGTVVDDALLICQERRFLTADGRHLTRITRDLRQVFDADINNPDSALMAVEHSVNKGYSQWTPLTISHTHSGPVVSDLFFSDIVTAAEAYRLPVRDAFSKFFTSAYELRSNTSIASGWLAVSNELLIPVPDTQDGNLELVVYTVDDEGLRRSSALVGNITVTNQVSIENIQVQAGNLLVETSGTPNYFDPPAIFDGNAWVLPLGDFTTVTEDGNIEVSGIGGTSDMALRIDGSSLKNANAVIQTFSEPGTFLLEEAGFSVTAQVTGGITSEVPVFDLGAYLCFRWQGGEQPVVSGATYLKQVQHQGEWLTYLSRDDQGEVSLEVPGYPGKLVLQFEDTQYVPSFKARSISTEDSQDVLNFRITAQAGSPVAARQGVLCMPTSSGVAVVAGGALMKEASIADPDPPVEVQAFSTWEASGWRQLAFFYDAAPPAFSYLGATALLEDDIYVVAGGGANAAVVTLDPLVHRLRAYIHPDLTSAVQANIVTGGTLESFVDSEPFGDPRIAGAFDATLFNIGSTLAITETLSDDFEFSAWFKPEFTGRPISYLDLRQSSILRIAEPNAFSLVTGFPTSISSTPPVSTTFSGGQFLLYFSAAFGRPYPVAFDSPWGIIALVENASDGTLMVRGYASLFISGGLLGAAYNGQQAVSTLAVPTSRTTVACRWTGSAFQFWVGALTEELTPTAALVRQTGSNLQAVGALATNRTTATDFFSGDILDIGFFSEVATVEVRFQLTVERHATANYEVASVATVLQAGDVVVQSNTDSGALSLVATTSTQTTQRLPASVWSHVALTRQDGVIRLYLNGIQVANGLRTGTLGTFQVGGGSFVGLVAGIRVTEDERIAQWGIGKYPAFRWNEINSNFPAERTGVAASSYGSQVLFLGGDLTDETYLGNTSGLYSAPLEGPSARSFAAMVPTSTGIVLHAGFDGGALSDTWTLDLEGAWQLRGTAGPQRYGSVHRTGLGDLLYLAGGSKDVQIGAGDAATTSLRSLTVAKDLWALGEDYTWRSLTRSFTRRPYDDHLGERYLGFNACSSQDCWDIAGGGPYEAVSRVHVSVQQPDSGCVFRDFEVDASQRLVRFTRVGAVFSDNFNSPILNTVEDEFTGNTHVYCSAQQAVVTTDGVVGLDAFERRTQAATVYDRAFLNQFAQLLVGNTVVESDVFDTEVRLVSFSEDSDVVIYNFGGNLVSRRISGSGVGSRYTAAPGNALLMATYKVPSLTNTLVLYFVQNSTLKAVLLREGVLPLELEAVVRVDVGLSNSVVATSVRDMAMFGDGQVHLAAALDSEVRIYSVAARGVIDGGGLQPIMVVSTVPFGRGPTESLRLTTSGQRAIFSSGTRFVELDFGGTYTQSQTAATIVGLGFRDGTSQVATVQDNVLSVGGLSVPASGFRSVAVGSRVFVGTTGYIQLASQPLSFGLKMDPGEYLLEADLVTELNRILQRVDASFEVALVDSSLRISHLLGVDFSLDIDASSDTILGGLTGSSTGGVLTGSSVPVVSGVTRPFLFLGPRQDEWYSASTKYDQAQDKWPFFTQIQLGDQRRGGVVRYEPRQLPTAKLERLDTVDRMYVRFQAPRSNGATDAKLFAFQGQCSVVVHLIAKKLKMKPPEIFAPAFRGTFAGAGRLQGVIDRPDIANFKGQRSKWVAAGTGGYLLESESESGSESDETVSESDSDLSLSSRE